MVPKAVVSICAHGQQGTPKGTGDKNGREKKGGQDNKVFSVIKEVSLIRGEYVSVSFRNCRVS